MWVALVTTLVAFLADACKGLVGRVLVALGIGAITAVGLNLALSTALTRISDAMQSTGQIYPALDAMGVVWFVATIVSAITTRLTLRGLMSEGLSFWVMRRGIATR